MKNFYFQGYINTDKKYIVKFKGLQKVYKTKNPHFKRAGFLFLNLRYTAKLILQA